MCDRISYRFPLFVRFRGFRRRSGAYHYNQQFAVVRVYHWAWLDLKQGVNTIQFEGATAAMLEPQSVILRDLAGRRVLHFLEQNYRADPISLDALLRRYEGQTIQFQVRNGDRTDLVSGKIVRASELQARNPGGQFVAPGPTQPIIEVDGKLQFNLPGTPLFPALGDALLKPMLNWTVETDRAGRLDAELAYVTGGFNWNADYNILQDDSDVLERVIGWVTMENRSGKEFEQAHVKLMAGDVNKIQPSGGGGGGGAVFANSAGLMSGVPPVQEKAFDEYHLYTLQRPVTIHDRETKQVEFVRAEGVKSAVVYIYDGAHIDNNRYRGNVDAIRNDSSYGTQSESVKSVGDAANSPTQTAIIWVCRCRKGASAFITTGIATDGWNSRVRDAIRSPYAEGRDNPGLHGRRIRPYRRAEADCVPERYGPPHHR